MALGGGNWILPSKILPGSYVNYTVARTATSTAGVRGISALAMKMTWGEPNKIIEIDQATFQNSTLEMFGYNYDATELKYLREIFRKSSKLLFYRLDKNGVKASNTYAEAVYPGTRGNKITIKISENVDQPSKKDVVTLLDGVKVDTQVVTAASELKANLFVTFKDTTLNNTAGEPLTGGTDGDEITGTEHRAFLTALESYYFNALACTVDDEDTKKLYIAYTERMRAEIGKNFQVVVHNYKRADSYSVVSVKNNTTPDLVYWVTGAIAGAEINKSLTNTLYDGELDVNTKYSQAELELAIKAGEFVLHKVEDTVRVLMDINTLVTYSADTGKDFSKNQTIRTLDWLSARYASAFNKDYIGQVPNDADGRISYWNTALDIAKEAAEMRAIEPVVAEDITVEPVEGDKTAIFVNLHIAIINAMEKMYASFIVR